MAKMEVLHLTPTERGELQSYLRKRNLPASVAQRMRIILLVDEGASYREIEEQLGAFPSMISRGKQRYGKDGVLGLATIHPGQPPQKLTAQLRAIGQTAARHTSQEFVAFLEEVVGTQPAGRQIHVILDNFSTHKTDLVKGFLVQHPNVNLHFTPTYSSWLNQVESWFSKLQRDVIDRGIFTSVADLKRKILRYIRLYQKSAKPFRWKYSDLRKRIPAW
jgi:transposase